MVELLYHRTLTCFYAHLMKSFSVVCVNHFEQLSHWSAMCDILIDPIEVTLKTHSNANCKWVCYNGGYVFVVFDNWFIFETKNDVLNCCLRMPDDSNFFPLKQMLEMAFKTMCPTNMIVILLRCITTYKACLKVHYNN